MSDLLAQNVRPRHHLALGLLIAAAHMLYYRGWSMDDPYITFRYLDHWVSGHGLVFNVGEAPVEGYSNFLWLLLLAPCRVLFGADSLMLAAQTLGFILALATGPLLVWTWQRTGPPAKDAAPLWRWLPLYLWAFSGPAMFWAVGGLEAPLVALLVTAALAAIQLHWDLDARLAAPMAVIFLLLALSRPEGAMYGVAFYAATATHWPRRAPSANRAWSLSLAVFLVGVALYTAWRWWHFGTPVPNTYWAKVGGPLWPRLLMGLEHLGDTILMTAGLPLLAWIGLWAWPRGPAIRAAGLFAFLQLAFIVWVGGDWMPGARFLVPAVPCLILLGTAGLRRSWDGLTTVTRKRWLPDLLILILLVWLGAALIAERCATREVVRLLRAGRLTEPLLEAATWLGTHAAPGDTVAGEEAGIIPFATDRRFLDLLGINDAHLARVPGAMNDKMDVDHVVNQWRPDWVLLLTTPGETSAEIRYHTGAGRRLGTSAAFRSHYTEVHEIPRQWGTVVMRIYRRANPQGQTTERVAR
jgi:arabinofuranosyltransferase